MPNVAPPLKAGFSMNENALLYTFSTVAQALAAGFAVLGAFALYRLRDMEQGLCQLTSTFDESSGIGSYRTWTLIREGGASAVGNWIDQERAKNANLYIRHGFADSVEEAVAWRNLYLLSQQWLKRSLVLTIVVIAICLGALPIVPWLNESWLGLPVAWGTVALALSALVVYAKLILLLLDTSTREIVLIFDHERYQAYRRSLRGRWFFLKVRWKNRRKQATRAD